MVAPPASSRALVIKQLGRQEGVFDIILEVANNVWIWTSGRWICMVLEWTLSKVPFTLHHLSGSESTLLDQDLETGKCEHLSELESGFEEASQPRFQSR